MSSEAAKALMGPLVPAGVAAAGAQAGRHCPPQEAGPGQHPFSTESLSPSVPKRLPGSRLPEGGRALAAARLPGTASGDTVTPQPEPGARRLRRAHSGHKGGSPPLRALEL